MHHGALFDRTADEGMAVTTRDVAATLFRRWRIVLGCAAITTALTTLGVTALSPTYEAHAKVFVQTERQLMPSFFAGLAPYSRRQEWDPASRRLENEMAQIDVRPVAARVVRELGLTWRDVAHSPLTQLLDIVRDRTAPVAARIGVAFQPPTEADTIAAFRSSLAVRPAESRSAETTSNVIVLTLRAPSAEGARAGLDKLLDVYLATDHTTGDVDAVEALALVDKELREAKREVASAERAMRSFLAASQFDPRNQAADRTSPTTSPRDDRTVTELKATLIGLETQLTEAKQHFRPTSETIRRLEVSIEDTRRRLSAEVSVGAGNYDRYNRLDRTLRATEARAQELERRRSEVALFTRIEPPADPGRHVIEPPILPEESDWRARAATLLLGSGLGVLLGIVLTGVREYTDTTLRSSADVRRHLGAAVLAVVPQATAAARRRVEAGLPGNVRSTGASAALDRAANALASRIMIAGGTGSRAHGRVILMTSAQPREGKTLVSTLLAHQLVVLGAGHVLLLDLDASTHHVSAPAHHTVPMRSDRHESPGDAPGEPLVDAEGASTHDRHLPALSTYHRQAIGEDLSGHRLRTIVDTERARFDWIVVDGRPVEDRGMVLLAQAVDVVALVVRADQTRQHVVRHALELLGTSGRAPAQVVLNRQTRPIPAFLYDWI